MAEPRDPFADAWKEKVPDEVKLLEEADALAKSEATKLAQPKATAIAGFEDLPPEPPPSRFGEALDELQAVVQALGEARGEEPMDAAEKARRKVGIQFGALPPPKGGDLGLFEAIGRAWRPRYLGEADDPQDERKTGAWGQPLKPDVVGPLTAGLDEVGWLPPGPLGDAAVYADEIVDMLHPGRWLTRRPLRAGVRVLQDIESVTGIGAAADALDVSRPSENIATLLGPVAAWQRPEQIFADIDEWRKQQATFEEAVAGWWREQAAASASVRQGDIGSALAHQIAAGGHQLAATWNLLPPGEAMVVGEDILPRESDAMRDLRVVGTSGAAPGQEFVMGRLRGAMIASPFPKLRQIAIDWQRELGLGDRRIKNLPIGNFFLANTFERVEKGIGMVQEADALWNVLERSTRLRDWNPAAKMLLRGVFIWNGFGADLLPWEGPLLWAVGAPYRAGRAWSAIAKLGREAGVAGEALRLATGRHVLDALIGQHGLSAADHLGYAVYQEMARTGQIPEIGGDLWRRMLVLARDRGVDLPGGSARAPLAADDLQGELVEVVDDFDGPLTRYDRKRQLRDDYISTLFRGTVDDTTQPLPELERTAAGLDEVVDGLTETTDVDVGTPAGLSSATTRKTPVELTGSSVGRWLDSIETTERTAPTVTLPESLRGEPTGGMGPATRDMPDIVTPSLKQHPDEMPPGASLGPEGPRVELAVRPENTSTGLSSHLYQGPREMTVASLVLGQMLGGTAKKDTVLRALQSAGIRQPKSILDDLIASGMVREVGDNLITGDLDKLLDLANQPAGLRHPVAEFIAQTMVMIQKGDGNVDLQELLDELIRVGADIENRVRSRVKSFPGTEQPGPTPMSEAGWNPRTPNNMARDRAARDAAQVADADIPMPQQDLDTALEYITDETLRTVMRDALLRQTINEDAPDWVRLLIAGQMADSPEWVLRAIQDAYSRGVRQPDLLTFLLTFDRGLAGDPRVLEAAHGLLYLDSRLGARGAVPDSIGADLPSWDLGDGWYLVPHQPPDGGLSFLVVQQKGGATIHHDMLQLDTVRTIIQPDPARTPVEQLRDAFNRVARAAERQAPRGVQVPDDMDAHIAAKLGTRDVGLNADWNSSAWELGDDVFLVDNEDGTYSVVHRDWNAEARGDDDYILEAASYTEDELVEWLDNNDPDLLREAGLEARRDAAVPVTPVDTSDPDYIFRVIEPHRGKIVGRDEFESWFNNEDPSMVLDELEDSGAVVRIPEEGMVWILNAGTDMAEDLADFMRLRGMARMSAGEVRMVVAAWEAGLRPGMEGKDIPWEVYTDIGVRMASRDPAAGDPQPLDEQTARALAENVRAGLRNMKVLEETPASGGLGSATGYKPATWHVSDDLDADFSTIMEALEDLDWTNAARRSNRFPLGNSGWDLQPPGFRTATRPKRSVRGRPTPESPSRGIDIERARYIAEELKHSGGYPPIADRPRGIQRALEMDYQAFRPGDEVRPDDPRVAEAMKTLGLENEDFPEAAVGEWLDELVKDRVLEAKTRRNPDTDTVEWYYEVHPEFHELVDDIRAVDEGGAPGSRRATEPWVDIETNRAPTRTHSPGPPLPRGWRQISGEEARGLGARRDVDVDETRFYTDGEYLVEDSWVGGARLYQLTGEGAYRPLQSGDELALDAYTGQGAPHISMIEAADIHRRGGGFVEVEERGGAQFVNWTPTKRTGREDFDEGDVWQRTFTREDFERAGFTKRPQGERRAPQGYRVADVIADMEDAIRSAVRDAQAAVPPPAAERTAAELAEEIDAAADVGKVLEDVAPPPAGAVDPKTGLPFLDLGEGTSLDRMNRAVEILKEEKFLVASQIPGDPPTLRRTLFSRLRGSGYKPFKVQGRTVWAKTEADAQLAASRLEAAAQPQPAPARDIDMDMMGGTVDDVDPRVLASRREKILERRLHKSYTETPSRQIRVGSGYDLGFADSFTRRKIETMVAEKRLWKNPRTGEIHGVKDEQEWLRLQQKYEADEARITAAAGDRRAAAAQRKEELRAERDLARARKDYTAGRAAEVEARVDEMDLDQPLESQVFENWADQEEFYRRVHGRGLRGPRRGLTPQMEALEDAATGGEPLVTGKRYEVVEYSLEEAEPVVVSGLTLEQAMKRHTERGMPWDQVRAMGSERPIAGWTRTTKRMKRAPGGKLEAGSLDIHGVGISPEEGEWLGVGRHPTRPTNGPYKNPWEHTVPAHRLALWQHVSYGGFGYVADTARALGRSVAKAFFGEPPAPGSLPPDGEAFLEILTEAARWQMRDQLGSDNLVRVTGNVWDTRTRAKDHMRAWRDDSRARGIDTKRWRVEDDHFVIPPDQHPAVVKLAQDVRELIPPQRMEPANWQRIVDAWFEKRAGQSANVRYSIRGTSRFHWSVARSLIDRIRNDPESVAAFGYERVQGLRARLQAEVSSLPPGTRELVEEILRALGRNSEELLMWLRQEHHVTGESSVLALLERYIDRHLADYGPVTGYEVQLADQILSGGATGALQREVKRIGRFTDAEYRLLQQSSGPEAVMMWAKRVRGEAIDYGRRLILAHVPGVDSRYARYGTQLAKRIHDDEALAAYSLILKGRLTGDDVLSTLDRILPNVKPMGVDEVALAYVLDLRADALMKSAIERLRYGGVALTGEQADLVRRALAGDIDRMTMSEVAWVTNYLRRTGLDDAIGVGEDLYQIEPGRWIPRDLVDELRRARTEGMGATGIGRRSTGTQRILNTVDNAQRIVRTGVLTGYGVPNVGTFVANFLTFPAIMWMTIGPQATGQSIYNLGRHAPFILEVLRELWRDRGFAVQGMRKAGQLVARVGNLGSPTFTVRLPNNRGFLTVGDVVEDALRYGFDSSRARAETQPAALQEMRTWAWNWFGRSASEWQEGIREMFHATDMLPRIATYITARKRGLPAQEAARLARDAMYDYSSLTRADREIGTRLFMFWGWNRKSVEHNLIALANNPERVGQMARAQRDQMNMWGLTEYEQLEMSPEDAVRLIMFRGEAEPMPSGAMDPRFSGKTYYLSSPNPSLGGLEMLRALETMARGFVGWASPEAYDASRRKVLQQMSPVVREGAAGLMGVDDFTEMDPNRTLREDAVPALLVEAPYIGDVIAELLDIQRAPVLKPGDTRLSVRHWDGHRYYYVPGSEAGMAAWTTLRTTIPRLLAQIDTLDRAAGYDFGGLRNDPTTLGGRPVAGPDPRPGLNRWDEVWRFLGVSAHPVLEPGRAMEKARTQQQRVADEEKARLELQLEQGDRP